MTAILILAFDPIMQAMLPTENVDHHTGDYHKIIVKSWMKQI